MATPKQTFALFCATGLDARELNLSIEKASELVGMTKEGKAEEAAKILQEMGAKGTVKIKNTVTVNFQAIYDEAHKAGMEAGTKSVPRPMVVQQHANPFDDNSEVIMQEVVNDGPCGFAWINFAGNTSFGRWAKKEGLASKSYPTGLCVWVGEFNQSITRKEAYARAFAKVLNDHGIKASPRSRMD